MDPISQMDLAKTTLDEIRANAARSRDLAAYQQALPRATSARARAGALLIAAGTRLAGSRQGTADQQVAATDGGM